MKLNIIEYNAEELVNGFISCKQDPIIKSHLTEVKNDISEADLQYRTLGNTNLLKTIRSIEFNDDQKISLTKCYTDKTNYRESIINEIRKENEFHSDYCPFCGYRRDPSEIDHYLPITDFPEFSFIPVNLIPICSKCNKTKNRYGIGNDDERLFLNKYFDDDNNIKFLMCKPKIIDEKNIIFEFCLNDDILNDMPIGNVIKTHYKKLNILTTYQDNSNSIISELDDSLVNFKGNIQNLKEWIKKQYENSRDKYGVNFYKTVTYKSIYETQDVLDWFFYRISDENKY